VQSLTTGDRRSLGAGGYARYLPSGHLLYLQDGTLFAVRLDTTEFRTIGVPETMIEGIANESAFNGAQFAVSASGTLVYVAGGTVRTGPPLIGWTRPGSPCRFGQFHRRGQTQCSIPADRD
jgi:hypothetical protein